MPVLLVVLGKLLQISTVASVAAAFALLLWGFMKPRPASPGLPDPPGLAAGQRLRPLFWAAFAALGSRALLVGLAYLALALANAQGSGETRALLAGYGFDKAFPPLQSIFSRWDAPHYLDIAKLGYTAEHLPPPHHDQWLFIVFYPLYPALVALVKPLFGTEFNAATVLSWGFLAGACWWIYKLARLHGDRGQAARAVKYLLVFPAAVFLGAPYTESLFLLLTALCLYALAEGRWWAAGVAGFFAALTRNLGALLVIPFAVEMIDRLGAFAEPGKLKTGRFWLAFLKAGACALLIPAGAGAYLLLNQIVYGDPLMFLKIQGDHWGQQAQPIWKTVLLTWNCLTGDRSADEKLFLWAPQLAGMLAMLAALPFMMRRLRPAHAAYLLVYVIVALMPSWLLSFNRYMMGAVPLFLGIAALTGRKWADIALTVVFTALMLFLAAGYFMWKMVV
jgi:hypothetical protein